MSPKNDEEDVEAMKPLTTAGIVSGLVMLTAASSCETDATVASRNLSTAADNFEVMRRVIFYNGITGEYIMEFQGRCSIRADRADNQLELTCKHGADEFRKHFLGLSDNATYFVEQMDGVDVSTYHTRVIWKPQSILPDIDFKWDTNELLNNQNTGG